MSIHVLAFTCMIRYIYTYVYMHMPVEHMYQHTYANTPQHGPGNILRCSLETEEIPANINPTNSPQHKLNTYPPTYSWEFSQMFSLNPTNIPRQEPN